MEWTWSAAHNDYYYVTYDAYSELMLSIASDCEGTNRVLRSSCVSLGKAATRTKSGLWTVHIRPDPIIQCCARPNGCTSFFGGSTSNAGNTCRSRYESRQFGWFDLLPILCCQSLRMFDDGNRTSSPVHPTMDGTKRSEGRLIRVRVV